MENTVTTTFRLDQKIAVVTGGSGVLGGALCAGLAAAGATVAVLARSADQVQATADDIVAAGGQAVGVAADVLDKDSLRAAAGRVLDRFGRIDLLVNGAGGNKPEATAVPGQRSFFDLPPDAMQWVFNLNLVGTILASQVFGEPMTRQGSGNIINISSMAAFSPLTRVVAYAAAKAAVNNFTQWLAVTMARDYNPAIRVNAIAPGFFLGEQNRYLLIDKETGELTPRGRTIIEHTPMGRFGDPDDLVGTLVWLASDASRFVTGVVVPVDGGFNAFSGV
ncbi:MAG: SDR family NAD(P)-dependent oxidoreductase [Chloroflexi bacterium]|nr:SDR family NAD(P)-dependent oxidoreductase [Chloroflexota bacterium]